MVSSSPPTSVHAKPVTCPTWFFCSATPKLKRRTPRYFSRLRDVTEIRVDCFFSNKALTALRQIFEISRSRLRTPASRV